MRYIFFSLLITVFACSPYKGMRRTSVSFTADGATEQVSFLLPRGKRDVQQTRDSAGNETFRIPYGGGAFLYFTRLSKGNEHLVDTVYHIGRPHIGGGLFYKGMEADGRFWRDVLSGPYRFGYRNAAYGKQEAQFDSTLNSVRLGAK